MKFGVAVYVLYQGAELFLKNYRGLTFRASTPDWVFLLIFWNTIFIFFKISYMTGKHPINPPINFPNPNKIEEAEVFF